jgi:hypothetical protein
MSPFEAQAWLALYNLLSSPETAGKLSLDASRLDRLAKLAPMLAQRSADLPFADSLRKWLLEASLSGTARANTSALLVEPISEITEGFVKKYE